MEFPPELGTIEGAKNLRDWFGYWPSFHDAEVILLHLNRSDASTRAVHTWEMTKEVDEKGFYVLAKHVVVEFVMKEVVGLSLNGFNHQNVVFGLAIERIDSGYRLTLEDCYGVAGTIDASDISIRLIPGSRERLLNAGMPGMCDQPEHVR